MTVLEWDKVGERTYETGIDRGVLYRTDGTAFPWNGLVSVVPNISREVKSYYMDGVKYLDRSVPGAYSAKMQAFTYPDVLDELLGTSEFSPGVYVHDQSAKYFHLSYRTKVANDIEGTDLGYKIHIIYNVTATPSDFTYTTLSDQASVSPFEWTLSGVPQTMFGIRPTGHISIDSRKIDPDLLTTMETMLYGDDETDPSLLSLVDLLALVEAS